MKILLVADKNDYDNHWNITPRKYSATYFLWYVPLCMFAKDHGYSFVPFWMDEAILEKGRDGMNRFLRDEIVREKPEVCFVCSGNWDLDRKILAEIQEKSSTVTVYVCGDDSWRFDSVSKYYAPYFSWVLTWCSGAVKKYHKLGCKNVIGSQTWVDIGLYRPMGEGKDIDVSFVGIWGAPRGEVIDYLRKAGVDVFVRGNGWPEGAVSQEEMIKIISRSKIGLSLNPPHSIFL